MRNVGYNVTLFFLGKKVHLLKVFFACYSLRERKVPETVHTQGDKSSKYGYFCLPRNLLVKCYTHNQVTAVPDGLILNLRILLWETD